MTFEYEKTVAELLTAAGISNLEVMSSSSIDSAKCQVLAVPTAIVILDDESAVPGQRNSEAALSEVTIVVYLLLRGVYPETTPQDQSLREDIFQALHGAWLEGLSSELFWENTLSDHKDDERTYAMTFKAQLVKRKR